MIQNTILTVILLVIIGCGAQNNPDKEENTLDVVVETPTTIPSAIPSVVPSSLPISEPLEGISVPSLLSPPMIKTKKLPEIISIKLPNTLDKTSNKKFVKNINNIRAIEEMARLNLTLLSDAMSKVLTECSISMSCHFQAEKLLLKYNEKNVTLEKIDFRQYAENKEYKYELTLTNPFNINLLTKLNDTITYKWTSDKMDILTLYKNKEENLSLRYLRDVDNNESMIVKSQKLGEYNSILVDKRKKKYHLSSNYIIKSSDAFSLNIFLEDGVLIKEDEEPIQIDINMKKREEGSYVLLPPSIDINTLNLKSVLNVTKGIFLFFHGEFQGFIYSDEFLDNVDELTIIQLTNKYKGFEPLSESKEPDIHIN